MSDPYLVYMIDGHSIQRVDQEHKEGVLFDIDGVRHIQHWGETMLVPLPQGRDLFRVVPRASQP